MRVLAATPYSEPEGGGLERYAGALLRRLAARGHDVHQLAFTRGPAGTGTTQEGEGALTVERVRPARVLGNTPLGAAYAHRARELAATLRPDVVVVHTPVPSAAQAMGRAAWRAGVPLVTTYHAGRLRGSSPLLDAAAALHRRTGEARLLARSSRLVAVSPFVRDAALRRHRGRVTVVPPGVDTRRYRPGADATPEGLLFVAPLSPRYAWKGLRPLLDAHAALRRDRPALTLTLVGDGPLRAPLQAKARERGLVLPGRLDEAGLVRAYQAASVVVLPSLTDAEAFGMVLAEANACGRPVVASRVGGVPSFVRDGDNGLLTPPGDVPALAEALGRLLDDPGAGDAMGRRGRARVVAEHDWDRLTDATESVLAGAVRDGPR